MPSLPEVPYLPAELLPIFCTEIGRGQIADQEKIAQFVAKLHQFKTDLSCVITDQDWPIKIKGLPQVSVDIVTVRERYDSLQIFYPPQSGAACFSRIKIEKIPFYHQDDVDCQPHLDARLQTMFYDGSPLHVNTCATKKALVSFSCVMESLFGRFWTEAADY